MRNETAVSATELLRQGAAMRELAQYDDAVRCLLRALEIKHDLAAAHLELGLAYLDQERLEDAVDYLELAVHFGPECGAGWQHLGAALAGLGRLDAALAACRQATAVDPNRCGAWLTLGGVHKAREEWKAAIDCYRTAATCDPESADALCLLGYALHRAGEYAESRAHFDSALQLSPDMVQAHHNLGLSFIETAQPAEALACFDRALAINGELIETSASRAHALRDLGRLNEAISSYDEILSTQPDFFDAVVNRAHALLMKGDYAAGWTAYEQRLDGGREIGRDFNLPRWRGEPLEGKRVLIYAEQGLGDEIMFASCLPDILSLAAHCTIECNTRLAPLFRRSFPAAHVHGGEKTDDAGWLAGFPPADYQIAIGSLANYFRRLPTAFRVRAGYLTAAATRVEHWNSQLISSAPLRVGIAWRGGTLKSRQYARSVPLPLWAPLLQTDQASFYALQYGDITLELECFRAQSRVAVADLGKAIDDLDELAAIINALDLVISVDSTVSHLAGALGKPVWTLLPASPEWRYPRSGVSMPWYPSMRLFHRALDESWETLLARVANDLARRVKSNGRR